MNKDQLIEAASSGQFINDPAFIPFADLDGQHAKAYLESRGFQVIQNYDAGRNGLAVTTCGITLSTNGYVCTMEK